MKHIALLWIVISCPFAAIAADDWEEVSRADDLVVFRKVMKDNPIFAYKGEALVKAPFERVLSVVMNTERRTEWMERVVESSTKKIISPYEKIDLMITRVPWPMRGREFLFRSIFQIDAKGKKATLRLESIEDPKFPQDPDRIRGWIQNATFELIATSDYTTRVTAESHTDPKGWLPAWIINLVQRTFPRKTLGRLTEQALKPDIESFKLR